MLAARRRWQREVWADLPPPLRARLDRVGGRNLADRFRREEVLDGHRPKLAIMLAEDYLQVAGPTDVLFHEPCDTSATGTRCVSSWGKAHQHLLTQDASLRRAKIGRAFDEDLIRDFANNYATMCADRRTHESRAEYATEHGVTPPDVEAYGIDGANARLCDPQWWRRQLRRVWTRRAENAFRSLGIVRKNREPYASDDAVTARRAQNDRNQKFLENHEAKNELGEQLTLIDAVSKSLANPAIRRAEFMTRARGFEEIAKELDHAAEFYTLTAPSAFHASLSKGGMNERWHAAGRPDVRAAQAWLCKMWAVARSRLQRLSIRVYGFRIAEPHHDGTPHWHLLLFMPQHHVEAVRTAIREVWLSDYKDEPGARDVRCKTIAIDTAKGSAVGYVAKYVAKNIDGAGVIGAEEDFETGTTIADNIVRVGAWAAIHGIRQFQQLGGPPVGVWRELRRLREPLDADKLEPVRAAASDASDWAMYINRMGGPERAARRASSTRTKYTREMRRIPMVDGFRLHTRQWRKKCGPRVASIRRPARPDEMPVVWLDRGAPRCVDRQGRIVYAPTKYGETPPDKAAGLVAFTDMRRFQSVDTRPRMWRIQRCTQRPSGVMNPPASAARGAEARNPIAGKSSGGLHAGRYPARGTYPAAESEGAGPASSGSSFFFSESDSDSELGPVAITVRSEKSPVASGAASCRYCNSRDGYYCRPPPQPP